jgi:hypothetical protein
MKNIEARAILDRCCMCYQIEWSIYQGHDGYICIKCFGHSSPDCIMWLRFLTIGLINRMRHRLFKR